MVFKSIREILDGRRFARIRPDATLEAASDLMREERVWVLPVTVDDALAGIITERDILRHVSQRGGFATAPVAEAMTVSVVTVETRSSVVDALERMLSTGFRRLPVLDTGQKVVGLLSVEDIPLDYKAMRPRYVAWRSGVAAE